MEKWTPEPEGNDLLTYAMWYAENGLPVFPCKVASKEPATEHSFYDATTDPDQIKAWWGKNPAYNIGGTSLGVVDLDTYKPEFNDPDIPQVDRDTPSQTTGRGGTQLFYEMNGAEYRCKGESQGVGFKGKGGYVVLAPSVHPDTGDRYQWDIAASPADLPIKPIPESVVSVLELDVAPEPGEYEPPEELSPEVHLKELQSAWININRINKEKVHDRASWIALGMTLRQLGDDGLTLWIEGSKIHEYEKYTVEEHERLWPTLHTEYKGKPLSLASLQWWADNDPKVERETPFMTRGEQAELEREKELLKEEYRRLFEDRIKELQKEISRKSGEPFRTIATFGDLLEETLPEQEFLAPGMVRGQLTLLHGPSEAGKSTITIKNLAMLSGGLSPWTEEEQEPLTCLYLDLENGKATLQNYAMRLLAGHPELRNGFSRLLYNSVDSQDENGDFPFSNWQLDRTGIGELEETINLRSIDTVLIDNFREATIGLNENASSEVSPVLSLLKAVTFRTGCSITLNHHDAKHGDYSGGTSFSTTAAYRTRVYRDDDDCTVFASKKSRTIKGGITRYSLEHETDDREVLIKTKVTINHAPIKKKRDADLLVRTILFVADRDSYTSWKELAEAVSSFIGDILAKYETLPLDLIPAKSLQTNHLSNKKKARSFLDQGEDKVITVNSSFDPPFKEVKKGVFEPTKL